MSNSFVGHPPTDDHRPMSDAPTVHCETDGPVSIVTIDRPAARDASIRRPPRTLAEAFRRFNADASHHVAALAGAAGTFSAGHDLKQTAAGHRGHLVDNGDGPMGPARLKPGKPVIAAVEGHDLAGGLELAQWCELRIAARNANFGVYCRRCGVPLMDLGTVRLPRLIGHGRAMDLILPGRTYRATKPKGSGLPIAQPSRVRRSPSLCAWRINLHGFRRRRCAATACRPSSNGRSCDQATNRRDRRNRGRRSPPRCRRRPPRQLLSGPEHGAVLHECNRQPRLIGSPRSGSRPRPQLSQSVVVITDQSLGSDWVAEICCAVRRKDNPFDSSTHAAAAAPDLWRPVGRCDAGAGWRCLRAGR